MQTVKKPETKVFSDEEMEKVGFFPRSHPITTTDVNFIPIKTQQNETELEVWIPIPSPKFANMYETIISNILETNFADIHFEIRRLKSEIQTLNMENNELKQRFDKIESYEKHRKLNFSEIEVVKIKELSDKEIEKKILKYLKKNKTQEVFPSDIAFEYNLDARKVFEISEKLKKNGKLN